MRTITAAQEQVLSGLLPSPRVRVSIKDATGSFRDLTTYPGINMVLGVEWGESIDDEGMTMTVRLKREVELLSLAPLMSNSALNRAFNPTGAANVLVNPAREVKLEWALVAANSEPVSGDWELGFHGYTEEPEWSDDVVTLECVDLGQRLRDTMIERERVYGYSQGGSATKGCRVYEVGTTYATGEMVIPGEGKRNNHFYEATTGGTTGSTEPTWPTGGGSTVASGTVTFTERGAASTTTGRPIETVMQQIIDDSLGSGVVTLWVPTSPSVTATWFKQDRVSVWQALQALADQLGWALRYMYDAGTTTFRLKLYDPERSKATVDRTFAPGQVYPPSKFGLDTTGIRNAVRVIYSDPADRLPNGTAKRKEVLVTDSTSIGIYGRRFMEVAESSSSNIDTLTEATRMANAALADLKDPYLESDFEVRFFPHAQLSDRYTLSANGVHFDVAQTYAVVGYRHSIAANRLRTALAFHGQPTIGWSRWLGLDGRLPQGKEIAGLHAVTGANIGNLTLALDNKTIGGATMSTVIELGKTAYPVELELHVSTTAAFAVTSGTMIGLVSGQTTQVSHLIPGVTYYTKAVPLFHNGTRIVRGEPTEETSFVAGYVELAHMNPEKFGPFPTNGEFEGWLQGSNSPPDHWSASVGTWGTGFRREVGLGGLYSVLLLDNAVANALRSSYFPVTAGHLYSLCALVEGFSSPEAGDEAVLSVEWFDTSKTIIGSADSFSLDLNAFTGRQLMTRTFDAPTSAAYGRVTVAKDSAATFGFYADNIECTDCGEGWHVVNSGGTEPAFLNSWANLGGVYTVARFRKNLEGEVIIEGLVTGGTIPAAIFTLPVGYRPGSNQNLYLPSVSNNLFGYFEIQNGGSVLPQGGNNAHFGIWARFMPDA